MSDITDKVGYQLGNRVEALLDELDTDVANVLRDAILADEIDGESMPDGYDELINSSLEAAIGLEHHLDKIGLSKALVKARRLRESIEDMT